MILWDYLLRRMLLFKDRVFTRSNNKIIYYRDLILETQMRAERLKNFTNVAVFEQGRIDEAYSILSVLASGKTLTLVHPYYQEADYNEIIANAKVDAAAFGVKIKRFKTKALWEYFGGILAYTSGSEGAPKAVLLRDENIIFNIENIAAYMNYTPDDKLLVYRSCTYLAVLTADLLVAVCNGMEVCFVDGAFAPSSIIAVALKEKVTTLNCTPSAFRCLIALLCRNGQGNLKKIVLSGEKIIACDIKRALNMFPTLKLHVGYGLTEAGPRVSMGRLSVDSPDGFAGKPLRGVRVKNGLTLTVKSDGIGAFYIAEDKRDLIDNDGWFDTKDVVKICGENLIINGRADDTVIRNGININLSGMEWKILQNPKISDCVVYSVTRQQNQPYIHAVVVANSNSADDKKLTKTIKRLFPVGVLQSVKAAHQIELLPNGKKNRAYYKDKEKTK